MSASIVDRLQILSSLRVPCLQFSRWGLFDEGCVLLSHHIQRLYETNTISIPIPIASSITNPITNAITITTPINRNENESFIAKEIDVTDNHISGGGVAALCELLRRVPGIRR